MKLSAIDSNDGLSLRGFPRSETDLPADNSTVVVYQNFFSDDQLDELDPAFVPHDGRANPYPMYYETYWLKKFWQSGQYKKTNYTGMVSWKFGQKTRIKGQKFIEFIRQNPGYDVYFINPFPHEVYLFFNVWDQAEVVHPGITELAQLLFDKAGYPIRISELGRNDHSTALYCNYWVGNAKFWDVFMSFVQPLFDCVTQELSEEERLKYFEHTTYAEPAPIFPFIFERLFSTLLLKDDSISSCPYRLSAEEIDRIYSENVDPIHWNRVKVMVDIIDKWDAGISRGQDPFQLRAQFSSIWNHRRI